MQKHQIAYCYLIALWFLVSCQSQRPTMAISEELQTPLLEYLGPEFSQQINQDSTLVLCSKENQQAHPRITKFAVCNLNDQKVIYQSSVRDGYVRWHSARELLIKDQTGVVQADSPSTVFIFNLETEKKSTHNPKNDE